MKGFVKDFNERKEEFLDNLIELEKDIWLLQHNIEMARKILYACDSYEDLQDFPDIDLEDGLEHIELF